MTTTVQIVGAIDQQGNLHLDVPTALPAGNVNVTVVIASLVSPRKKNPKRALRLAGTLSWKGDPMEIQREMRSEWSD
ncbi:MAG: hypothetical protein H7144_04070 [Burkholderiales bacterium]|nr:hypothetical protein [Phycisphaerae bacterium]